MAETDHNPSRRSSAVSLAASAVVSILLAVTFFAAGFAACTLPVTPNLLSRMFSNFETSVYLPEDTVQLAVATRDFTVDVHAQGHDAATADLAAKILEAAKKASATGSLKAPAWKGITVPDQKTKTIGMYDLSKHGSAYAFGENEISHLIDCNELINRVVPVLVVVAALAVILAVILRVAFGNQGLGRALVAAPAVLLAGMVALGVWAAVDFSGFFTAFHGLFFPQGNWTFPFDSLLICMLPTPFWIGMAVLWIVVTVGISLVSIAIGNRLRRW